MKRLQTRAQFLAVLNSNTLARSRHFALHSHAFTSQTVTASPGEAVKTVFVDRSLQVGAMSPKKWAKRAVTRNVVKRQVFSKFAEVAHAIPEAAYVVRLRAAFDKTHFPSAASLALKAAIREELTAIFKSAFPHIAVKQ